MAFTMSTYLYILGFFSALGACGWFIGRGMLSMKQLLDMSV